MTRPIFALLLAICLPAGPALALKNFDPRFPGGGEIYQPDPVAMCENSLAAKLIELGNRGIRLGAPIDDIRWVSGWCYRAYQAGMIYSTVPLGGSSAVAVYGPTLDEFSSMGLHTGPLSRPLREPVASPDGESQRALFVNGIIDVHPIWGNHAVVAPLTHLWLIDEARFGHPIDDPTAMPGGIGTFTVFEDGTGAYVPSLGAWTDYTGVANDGQANATVQLFDLEGRAGTTRSDLLSTQAPIRYSAQLGAMNNLASSLTLSGVGPRSEVYLFDGALTGRHVRVSGANGTVRVDALGGFMGNRASSLLLANHGSASLRLTTAQLQALIQGAIESVPTDELIAAALAGRDASGSIEWRGDVEVTVLPEERAIKISQRAYMDVNADCALIFNCNADGEVRFDLWIRPQMMGPVTVHADLRNGVATSLSCDGRGCDDRAAALASLFSNATVVNAIEDAFDAALGQREGELLALQSLCDGIGMRRVNVLPGYVEVVLADAPDAGACAARIAGDQLSTDRPAAVAENSDGTRLVTSVSGFRNVAAVGGVLLAR